MPPRTDACQRAENTQTTPVALSPVIQGHLLIVSELGHCPTSDGRFARFSTTYGSESSNLPEQKHQGMVYRVETFCSLCCYGGFL